ncbi:hypothetical protein RHMOL_Rhmol01G0212500 [Rhododendron molle]|uniref:Uncharacterized protein n=1 Tax=Rhododendron molle TaxID=49168 RepID=A0ACC0Q5R4_RHOML|nr:hypothetical protein RHMOL_Rhmol01G0212500 [Rhododendron molle]
MFQRACVGGLQVTTPGFLYLYMYKNMQTPVELVSHANSFIRYTRKQHLVDVTEIFNQLLWEKQLRIYKLVYLAFLLFLSIFWMIWSIVE